MGIAVSKQLVQHLSRACAGPERWGEQAAQTGFPHSLHSFIGQYVVNSTLQRLQA
jgi:hypothetical protein